jgi:hypothetical protein
MNDNNNSYINSLKQERSLPSSIEFPQAESQQVKKAKTAASTVFPLDESVAPGSKRERTEEERNCQKEEVSPPKTLKIKFVVPGRWTIFQKTVTKIVRTKVGKEIHPKDSHRKELDEPYVKKRSVFHSLNLKRQKWISERNRLMFALKVEEAVLQTFHELVTASEALKKAKGLKSIKSVVESVSVILEGDLTSMPVTLETVECVLRLPSLPIQRQTEVSLQ